MSIILWSFCDLKLVQSEKISQTKPTLCPTHEGMVEIASVLDFFKKHNTTSTVDPECKKSGNFTTNGPPFRSRFCPFDFVTKRKKQSPQSLQNMFFMREKLLSPDEAISKSSKMGRPWGADLLIIYFCIYFIDFIDFFQIIDFFHEKSR